MGNHLNRIHSIEKIVQQILSLFSSCELLSVTNVSEQQKLLQLTFPWAGKDAQNNQSTAWNASELAGQPKSSTKSYLP